MSNTLYDEIVRGLATTKKPKPREAIRIDRSNVDDFAKCSLMCKARLLGEIRERNRVAVCNNTRLDYSDRWWLKKFKVAPENIPAEYRKVPDADASRPANVGIEFHRIMADYITELIDTSDARNPEGLCQLAVAGDVRYQPELLHLAKLTGPRISIWGGSYICHEKQFSYTLPRSGPAGEDVALSCRPDLVLRGFEPKSVRIIDWKTGWGRDFGLQAMFYAVVAWRYLADIESVVWQPFYCRTGTWGKPCEYNLQALEDAENVIKAAVGQMLTEEDWSPQPGTERCRYCPIKESCDAEKRYADIDDDRVAFAGATEKLQEQVKDRLKVMKADEVNGPIQVDGSWWGTNPINQRPTYKKNKGTPGFIGGDEDEEEEKE